MTPTTTHPTNTATTPPTSAAPHPCAITIDALTHTYTHKKKQPRNRNATQPIQKSKTKNNTPPPALQNISLTIPDATIFGILGPNASGKSTLLHILATLIKPNAGTAKIFGHDVRTHPADVRKHIGIVFQSPCLDRHLSARQNLQYHADLYGLPKRDIPKRIEQLLACVGLTDRADDLISQFSGGMKRRAEIAKTLLPAPDLLLMDEPTNGLDPIARRDFWQILETLRDQLGTTIAMATHDLDTAEHANQLAILDHGKLLAFDSPTNLIKRIGGDIISIEPFQNTDKNQLTLDITQQLGPWENLDATPKIINHTIRFEHPHADHAIATLRREHPQKIKRLTLGNPTLDDVFTHLTGRTFHNTD